MAPGNRTWKESKCWESRTPCRVGIPYFRNQEGPFIRFEDPQGAFIVKDTSLVDLRDREIVIKLDSVQ